jgi:competence protein ComEC
MGKISAKHTPDRIRLTLLSKAKNKHLYPGSIIKTIGFMMPPQSPVEPSGFDFRRYAWFLKLGAVGYTRKPVGVLEPRRHSLDLALFKYRMKFSRQLQKNMPDRTAGFAAAIMTGDRSAIERNHFIALRQSNLARPLAISGLHMGLLGGVIFWALRLILMSAPLFLLQSNAKKNRGNWGIDICIYLLRIVGVQYSNSACIFNGFTHALRYFVRSERSEFACGCFGCLDHFNLPARIFAFGRLSNVLCGRICFGD